MDATKGREVRVAAAAAREHARQLTEDSEVRQSAATELLAEQARQLAELRSKISNLEIALETNRRIGQAIGIIMARRLVTENEAFDLLRDLSRRGHCKLRHVAELVVLTGDLPDEAA